MVNELIYSCSKEQSDIALDVEQDVGSPGQSRVMTLPRKQVSIELVLHLSFGTHEHGFMLTHTSFRSLIERSIAEQKELAKRCRHRPDRAQVEKTQLK